MNKLATKYTRKGKKYNKKDLAKKLDGLAKKVAKRQGERLTEFCWNFVAGQIRYLEYLLLNPKGVT